MRAGLEAALQLLEMQPSYGTREVLQVPPLSLSLARSRALSRCYRHPIKALFRWCTDTLIQGY
jgi:hypothetical protein